MTDKKELYKKYVQEAVANLNDQDLLKLRMKEICEAVKESDIDVKEFKAIVKAAYDLQKVQEQADALLASIEAVEELGL